MSVVETVKEIYKQDLIRFGGCPGWHLTDGISERCENCGQFADNNHLTLYIILRMADIEGEEQC